MTTPATEVPLPPQQLGDRFVIFPTRNRIATMQNGTPRRHRKLEPRVMDVLVRLMAARGVLVSKQELVDQVWAGYGGGEEGLIQAVSKLRRAFGDDARSPEVIETVVKRGYRLLLPVTPYTAPAIAAATYSAQAATASASSLPARTLPGLVVFLDRLTRPRFLLAFILFSAVCIMFLGALGQAIFWFGVMIGAI